MVWHGLAWLGLSWIFARRSFHFQHLQQTTISAALLYPFIHFWRAEIDFIDLRVHQSGCYCGPSVVSQSSRKTDQMIPIVFESPLLDPRI